MGQADRIANEIVPAVVARDESTVSSMATNNTPEVPSKSRPTLT